MPQHIMSHTALGLGGPAEGAGSAGMMARQPRRNPPPPEVPCEKRPAALASARARTP